MARRARGAIVPFRHEGQRAALGPGDLLRAVLHDRMRVGRHQRLGVAHVDLLLAGARLALRVLDRHAGGVQPGADRPHHLLLLGGLEDVVVLVVGAEGREAAVAGRLQLLVGLAEQEELELGGHHGAIAQRREPRDLALEHRARRMRHLGMGVMIDHVAEHQRRAGQPGREPQRREVRRHRVVAVAGGPARRLVARHRLHLEVGGEQVVAAVGLAPAGSRGRTRPGTACPSAGPACRRAPRARCRPRPRRRPAPAPPGSSRPA